MKTAWRKVLENWKSRNPKISTVAKDAFPSLLREGLIQMDQVANKKDDVSLSSNSSAISRNLICSFEATGIYPWNKDRVLNKLPRDEIEADAPVRDVLVSYLRDQRYGSEAVPAKKKKTRLQVEPGKSVATVDSEESDQDQIEDRAEQDRRDEEEQGPSNENKDEDEQGPLYDNELDDENEDNQCVGPQIGKFILAKFQSTKVNKTYQYVCLIEDVTKNKIVVKGLKSVKKDKKKFRIVEDDVSIIGEEDIITYLPQPEFKQNIYVFPTDINVVEL
ncbi:hypothetical protein O0L34_g9251 [Tuta absoluta]|nr:hypothetical protein O0L34_g9251 [Tuta absoluta]